MTMERWKEWSFQGLLRFSAQHRVPLVGGAILAMAQSGTALLLPLAAGGFAAVVVAHRPEAGLPAAAYLVGLFALFALYALFSFGSNYLISTTETVMGCRLREALYQRLQSLPLSWFKEQRIGRILGILTIDVEAATTFASGVPARILPIFVMLTGALICVARMDAWVLLAATLTSFPLYLLVRKLSGPLPRLTGELADLHGELYSVVQENLEHLLAIKACTREEAELERAIAARTTPSGACRTSTSGGRFWSHR